LREIGRYAKQIAFDQLSFGVGGAAFGEAAMAD
jgi:hypothetical protein